MTQKLVVDISPSSGCGIIVGCTSGIFYTRQTGGININKPEFEGCFLPYDYDAEHMARIGLPNIVIYLRKLFGFETNYKGRSIEIDEETAVIIDGILEKLTHRGPLTDVQPKKIGSGFLIKKSSVKVDRNFLGKSHESWVFVTIKREDNLDLRGVFTWENSD